MFKPTQEPSRPVSNRTAYVLPDDYGYGFRGPQDKIWGLWPSDSLTFNIMYGLAHGHEIIRHNLDIVYPDGAQTVESAGYQNNHWNDTVLQYLAFPYLLKTVSCLFMQHSLLLLRLQQAL